MWFFYALVLPAFALPGIIWGVLDALAIHSFDQYGMSVGALVWVFAFFSSIMHLLILLPIGRELSEPSRTDGVAFGAILIFLNIAAYLVSLWATAAIAFSFLT